MYSACAFGRTAPLVVVLGTLPAADELARRLRQDGAVVYIAHTAEACVRVSTSLGPDAIHVDARFPKRMRRLLAAHPATARSPLVDTETPGVAALTV